MPCPICGQKPMNCDCTELECTSHNKIEELEESNEKLKTLVKKLKEDLEISKMIIRNLTTDVVIN